MSAEPLRVVLCWHMHQPDYREAYSREFLEPWTGLHALKDYADMAAHIEQVPGATAVFDFSPVLLDQLADYAARLENHARTGVPIGEPLLDALAQPVLPAGEDRRRELVRACLNAHDRHMIERYPAYRKLATLSGSVLDAPDSLDYVDDRFISDLLVWFHLTWLAETLKRDDREVARLIAKESNYTYSDRCALLEIITETLTGIIPGYRRLADANRIELATCPYGHPVLPLLRDLASSRQARPGQRLPGADTYPGGAERVEWHLNAAVKAHRDHFGRSAVGCWPSEGAICDASLEAIGQAGFSWTASGGQVLEHSLGEAHLPSQRLHRPYRLGDDGPVCFFRDDRLSDLIGFTYKNWHGDDAVADFVGQLENIAAEDAEPGRVVAVILDGENAWEHYPENGYHFIGPLYRRLVRHPGIELTTFSRCIKDPGVPVGILERVVAGSWVHGNLDTWIGDDDKNHAWDMLVAAKRAWDEAGDEARGRAQAQLAICEGSDWFWWPGEYNPAEAVARFERLFRRHLADLYRLLGQAPPEYLEHAFARGAGAPEGGGTMRPAR